jgi:hypothetical protein
MNIMPTQKKSSGGAKGDSAGKSKIHKVMHEFKEGELHAGKSGKIVKKHDQAVAIALSEAREAGAKNPKKSKKD